MGLKDIIDSVPKDEETTTPAPTGAMIDIKAETAQLVADFAEVEAALKLWGGKRDVLKARAIELHEIHGIDDFVGPNGDKVQIIHKPGSSRIDPKAVRKLLTEDQISAVTVVGEPSVSVSYRPIPKD